MAFSYGEPNQNDEFNSLSEILGLLGGSLNRGLDKINYFAGRDLTYTDNLTSNYCRFLFLSLATLQVEKIRH